MITVKRTCPIAIRTRQAAGDQRYVIWLARVRNGEVLPEHHPLLCAINHELLAFSSLRITVLQNNHNDPLNTYRRELWNCISRGGEWCTDRSTAKQGEQAVPDSGLQWASMQRENDCDQQNGAALEQGDLQRME